ncbi:MAG: PqqD family peptide modification chaperone [Vallitaleaceae bacterium]|nr:PqqD family peptide modification chaperone [Vallitaleaceae bacterium]
MGHDEFNKEAVIRKKELIVIDFDGELAMNDTEKGIHYGMNTVGTRIWKLLDEPQTMASIVAYLLTQYEVDKEDCIEEVYNFLSDLYERGLICMENTKSE